MRNALAATVLALSVGGAAADPVEDALRAALDAWRAGDAEAAREELDLASTLMDDATADRLSAFLPEAQDGWTRTADEAAATPAFMFGGGLSASATYESAGRTVEIEIFANNPMVAAMAPMLATPQLMAAAGEVRRVDGRRYLVTGDQVLALIDDRILIQVSGTASRGSKIAYFETIDFDGLEAF